MPNRAVVMSGGGAKGAFQVGALDYLIHDEGMDFQVIAGVSTGSLNATILAQASSAAELREYQQRLKEIWFSIGSDRTIYLKRFLGKILLFLSKSSLYNPEPLWQMLRRYASPEKIANSQKELRIGAVSLESGLYCEIGPRQQHLLSWTLGSSSMPLFFPPVPANGEHLVDGGVRSVTPLEGAFKALKELAPAQQPDPPDEMYVILASPIAVKPERRTWRTGLDVGMRTAGILINEIYREDLDYALLVNESVCGYLELERALVTAVGSDRARALLASVTFPYRPPDFREVRIFAIVPRTEFADSLQFDPRRIRDAFDAGRVAARERLDGAGLRKLLRDTSTKHELGAEPRAQGAA